MLDAKLVVVGGETKTKEVKLRLPAVIGRGRGVTLTLPHPLVSRRHCEIFEHDGRLMVRDLRSLNGTYVDNQKIQDAHVLEPDHLLTIGTVTFRAIYTIDASVDGASQLTVRGDADTIQPDTVDPATRNADTKPHPGSPVRPREVITPSAIDALDQTAPGSPAVSAGSSNIHDETKTPAATPALAAMIVDAAGGRSQALAASPEAHAQRPA
jgi:predicted component of type VI protein secretion system